MSGAGQNERFPSAASSSYSPALDTPTSSDHDELDYLGEDDLVGVDALVLDDDPIHSDLDSHLSFKRKQKASLLSSPLRLLSSLAGPSSLQLPPPPNQPRQSPNTFGGAQSPRRNALNAAASAAKDSDGAAHDWYTEGPGRRVGYEDLTAIDWIFEYTKERQRLRVLSSSAGGGLIGYVRHLLDASQVWIILLLTGVSVGAIAAGIDVTTDWLGDLKLGFCSSGPEGGHFYLSKSFCCYGYDQGSKCVGWTSWSEALGVHSAGGSWFIGYLFYMIFAVRFHCFVPFF